MSIKRKNTNRGGTGLQEGWKDGFRKKLNLNSRQRAREAEEAMHNSR